MSRLGKLLRGLFGGGDAEPDEAPERRVERRRGALAIDDDRASREVGRASGAPPRPHRARGLPDDLEGDEREEIPDVVRVPIEDALDLHAFPPDETRHVVEAYIEEAVFRGMREVRIIHGRGKGVQRQMVRSLLEHHPLVVDFFDADPGRGGWGATVARLRELGEARVDPARDASAGTSADV